MVMCLSARRHCRGAEMHFGMLAFQPGRISRALNGRDYHADWRRAS
jgi:hypothetical protein